MDLAGVRNLNIYEEYDFYSKNGWTIPFHEICRTCTTYPYKYNEARKPQNKAFNRYRDVNPYDHSRIVLSRGNTDYINANILEVPRARRKYILTQGPLAQTVSHFWLMVWEQNSEIIIMLNKIIEKNEIKCHWYWPEEGGEIKRVEFRDVNIAVIQLAENEYNYYTVRKFLMTDLLTGESREVSHYHYITWPDFGVPAKPGLFLDFLEVVRKGGMNDTEEHPPVVHCSAGIGRSGTFCLIDSALVVYEIEGVEDLNIKDMVLNMRRYRMGLIQTPEQLRFSYETILEGIKRVNNAVAQPEATEYDEVAVPKENEDETPPPPPPRGESLNAPARPLPPPPPPPPAAPTNALPPRPTSEASSSSSSSSDESHPNAPSHGSSLIESDTDLRLEQNEMRRRRVRDLAERVTAMRRRARVADDWHSFKRSMYKPLTITCGIIICGIIGYTMINQRT